MTGSNPDFNIYLEKYNNQIDYIREHGVNFNDKIYKFKIHILIADAPARAKACNMNQFNGKFACIKCLHPTFYKNHTTIYPTLRILNALESDDQKSITKVINLRSKKDYLMQVDIAEDSNETYKGIKGKTYLAN